MGVDTTRYGGDLVWLGLLLCSALLQQASGEKRARRATMEINEPTKQRVEDNEV